MSEALFVSESITLRCCRCSAAIEFALGTHVIVERATNLETWQAIEWGTIPTVVCTVCSNFDAASQPLVLVGVQTIFYIPPDDELIDIGLSSILRQLGYLLMQRFPDASLTTVICRDVPGLKQALRSEYVRWSDQDILQALARYLQVTNAIEAVRIVEQYAPLLAPRALGLFENMRRDLVASRDPSVERHFAILIDFLQRSQEVGPLVAHIERSRQLRGIAYATAEVCRRIDSGELPQAAISDDTVRAQIRQKNPIDYRKISKAARELLEMTIEQHPERLPEVFAIVHRLPLDMRQLYLDLFESGQLEQTDFEHPITPELVRLRDELNLAAQRHEQSLDTPEQAGFRDDRRRIATAIREYQHKNNVDLLVSAREAWERINVSPLLKIEFPNFADYLLSSMTFFRFLYEALGDAADLDRTIHFGQQLADDSAASTENRATAKHVLSGSLLRRFDELSGDRADLEAAIAMAQSALDHFQAGEERAVCLANCGIGLLRRYYIDNKDDDLRQAVTACESAYTIVPVTSRERPHVLTTLAIVLKARFRRYANEADLKRGAAVAAEALDSVPKDSWDRARMIGNVGSVLDQRFAQGRGIEDLSESIRLLQMMADRLAPTAPDRPKLMLNLGITLHERYRISHDPSDLIDELRVLRALLDTLPDHSTIVPVVTDALAQGLLALGQLNNDPALYLQARQLSTNAIEQAPERGEEKQRALIGQAEICIRYANRTRGAEDIALAVTAAENALVASPGDSIAEAISIGMHAHALRLLYEQDHSATTLQRGIVAFEQASNRQSIQAPVVAMRTASAWGDWACERSSWEEAYRAYVIALEALDAIYKRQILETSRENLLSEGTRIHIYAAYALLQIDNKHIDHLREAVLLLERGRARNLSTSLLRERAELSELTLNHPELAAAYRSAVLRIQQFDAAASEIEGSKLSRRMSVPQPMQLKQARDAAAELERVIGQIQALPGYEHMFQPISWHDVEAVVDPEKAVVYLLTAPLGSLALIVTATPNVAITLCALDLKEHDLDQMLFGTLNGWIPTYVREHNGGLRLGRNLRPLPEAKEQGTTAVQTWHQVIDTVTRRLWDDLIGPVIETVNTMGLKRIVFVPTGHLSLLPLHAAWTDGAGTRQYALDRAIISYTPSARILREAKRNVPEAVTHLLGVAAPQPSKIGSLPAAVAEVRAISEWFKPYTMLKYEEATITTVRSLLASAQVVHFACHGGVNREDPQQSGLLLADDKVLTVADISAVRIHKGRLAVLSACETGIVGTELPDEVVALPAAFLRAGYAGVVASLWAVADASTALLMEEFYRRWRSEGLAPDDALREAQRWLRDQAGNGHTYSHPYWWAAFHIVGV